MTFIKENYPANWRDISLRIREREGNRCKWCGVPNGKYIVRSQDGTKVDYQFDACELVDNDFYLAWDEDEDGDVASEMYEFDPRGPRPVKIVLTVAHYPDPDPMNCADDNLQALCQSCHNRLDAPMRAKHAVATRAKNKLQAIAATGQAALFDDDPQHHGAAHRTGDVAGRGRSKMTTETLKSPFPYFGGKSKVAPVVWQYFGVVQNFVEPFFGSGAILLGCPNPGHTETVNDADGLLCNFFRALQGDPDAVAYHADYPVMELDLHARHRWLVNARPEIERLLADPAYFDAKAAGWWVWGISQWIGSGWCESKRTSEHNKRPHLLSKKGINRDLGSPALISQVRDLYGKIPHLGDEGRGIHRASNAHASFGQLPHLAGDSGAAGQGINATAFDRKTGGIRAYFQHLATRLRRVRVTCGDFERVLGPSVTIKHGTTAVFLDPPYDLSKRASVYAVETDAAHRAKEWAVANGDNPLLRIALCGYGLEMPDTWTRYRWKTSGGYGSQGEGRGRENASKEEIWFSQNCIHKTPLELYADEMNA